MDVEEDGIRGVINLSLKKRLRNATSIDLKHITCFGIDKNYRFALEAGFITFEGIKPE